MVKRTFLLLYFSFNGTLALKQNNVCPLLRQIVCINYHIRQLDFEVRLTLFTKQLSEYKTVNKVHRKSLFKVLNKG